MDLIHHRGPAGDCFVAKEMRDRRLAQPGAAHRGGMIDANTFRDDETDAAFRASPVVTSDIRARHAARREIARHRRHNHPVGQGEVPQLKLLEHR